MQLFLFSLLAIVISVSTTFAEEAKIIEFDPGEKQLFLDDHIVKQTEGLTKTVHQPVDFQSNPVLVSEHPWEHRRIPFGSVYYSEAENKFRCWYLAMNIYDSRPGFRGYRKQHHVPLHEAAFICYAESEDGLHWHKPELGLHEYRGSKKNNIVLTCPGSHFDSTSVMHTPHDLEHPWKMISFIGRWPYQKDLIKKQWGNDFKFGVDQAAHYAWSSKDGIHWSPMNNGEPVLRANDRSMFWWDSKQHKYIGSAKTSFRQKRSQKYAWSDDIMKWTVTPTWMSRADQLDHPGDHSEAAYGFNYHGQYVGFCEMRRIRKGQPVKINWELLVSHDGQHWNRPLRELFIPDGPKESWRFQVLKVFANPPIEKEGQLWIYYGGKTGKVSVEEGTEPFQGLCLARLRMDGFVSLDSGKDEGSMTTKLFKIPKGKLHLNADAQQGELRVKMLDQEGNTIAESEPIQGDHLNVEVLFDHDIPKGEIVSLKITSRNCQIYSFWFE